MTDSSVVIVGGACGLGLELAKQYSQEEGHKVYATTRGTGNPDPKATAINWIRGVDMTSEPGCKQLCQALGNVPISVLIITAGHGDHESGPYGERKWRSEEATYKAAAVAPVFITLQLTKSRALNDGSKVIFVGIREGAHGWGLHASKHAMYTAGRLLAIDLKPLRIAVVAAHPMEVQILRTDCGQYENKRSGKSSKHELGKSADAKDSKRAVVGVEDMAKSLMSYIRTVDTLEVGGFFTPPIGMNFGEFKGVEVERAEEPVPDGFMRLDNGRVVNIGQRRSAYE